MSIVIGVICFIVVMGPAVSLFIQGADKSLARPDWKNNRKVVFSSNAEDTAAAETWLARQPSEFCWVACKS